MVLLTRHFDLIEAADQVSFPLRTPQLVLADVLQRLVKQGFSTTHKELLIHEKMCMNTIAVHYFPD